MTLIHRITGVGREDKGMYQCVVRRQEGDTFQASAELQLGGKECSYLINLNWIKVVEKFWQVKMCNFLNDKRPFRCVYNETTIKKENYKIHFLLIEQR